MNPQALVMMLKSAAIARDWARVVDIIAILEHLTGRVLLPLDGDRVTQLVNGTLDRIASDAKHLQDEGFLPGQGCSDPNCTGAHCSAARRPADHPAPDFTSETATEPETPAEPEDDIETTLRDDSAMPGDGPFVLKFQNGQSVTLDYRPQLPFVLWTRIPGEQ